VDARHGREQRKLQYDDRQLGFDRVHLGTPRGAVRDTQRYTREFVDREERATLSFFSPEYRAALEYCGSRTGRTEDKIRNAGLTVACTDDGVPAPAEARLILQCRKLYVGRIRPEGFVDRSCDTKWYPQHDYHEVYIAEIERAYVRK
jgi:flavin reductase (DIM6/NTAB) family NADH-FMN oxidoreductase RutF